MYINPLTYSVKCQFQDTIPETGDMCHSRTEVFFAETENIISSYSELKNFVSQEELQRAQKFYSDADRMTYICCHSILRLILSLRLGANPKDLNFIIDKYNKPWLNVSSAFFNITHTKNAFAIAFSKNCKIGVDLEVINERINIDAVIRNHFDQKEWNYILCKNEGTVRDRFIQLWTHKEALLKAIGTGITNDLKKIIVSEPVNNLDRNFFGGIENKALSKEYFIYSAKLLNYYLSVAVPKKCNITLHELSNRNFEDFLTKAKRAVRLRKCNELRGIKRLLN